MVRADLLGTNLLCYDCCNLLDKILHCHVNSEATDKNKKLTFFCVNEKRFG
ncbi:hypothetical protein NUACC21_59450 [Scytonema sp. NUACC21]